MTAMLWIMLGLLTIQVLYHAALRVGWSRAVARGAAAGSPGAAAAGGGGLAGSHRAAGGGPVSVVVAARDEQDRIETLLRALAGQTFRDFEVVIVDDGSVDRTAAIVHDAAARDPRFRLVENPEPRAPRKKNALMVGIQAARHDRLAFTDADCDVPPGWLAGLARTLDAGSGRTLVVGVGLPTRAAGMLNALQRWDAALAAYAAGGAIGWNRPWLAKGSNMAYDRAVFDAVGGFSSGLASLSGDDDLMVQEVARRGVGTVVFLADAATIVPSPSPDTWRGWVRQKTRHTSASRHYSRAVQVHLALYHGSATLLWLAPVVAGLPGLAVLAARILIVAVVVEGPLRRLGSADLIARAPVLDYLHALYHAVVPAIGFFRGARRW